MKNKNTIPSIIAVTFLTLSATYAAPVVWAEYHLGEPGSVDPDYQQPYDSSGNGHHFPHAVGGDATTPALIGTDSFHPDAEGSTAYLDNNIPTVRGWHGVGTTYQGLPTNNFGAGIYVRAPENRAKVAGTLENPGVTRDLFMLGGDIGRLKFSLESNGWGASLDNLAWIGSANGIPGSFTPNVWVHLAVIRQAGVSTFYIDGVAQPGTTTATPVHNSPLLGVAPGALDFFKGNFDEARLVTFDASDSTASILAAIQKPAAPLTAFVNIGAEKNVFSANLSTDDQSIFRLGGAVEDSVIVNNPDGLSVVAGTAATHLIHIAREGPIGVGTYPLISYTGSLGGLGFAGLELAPLPGRISGTLVNNISDPGNPVIELVVTSSVDGEITWTAAANSTWDKTTTNWVFTGSSTATKFFTADTVLMDDTAALTAVTIDGSVEPAALTIDNTSKDYQFSGGSIAGTGSLEKFGTGTLTFTNSNTHTGFIDLFEGTINVGGGGETGSLGTGPLINSATLIIDRSGTLTMPNAISGEGSLEKRGSGILTLSGNSSFYGPVTVSEGTLVSGNANCLGDISEGTTVAAGATLDVQGPGLGNEPVTIHGNGVDGKGAVVKSGGVSDGNGLKQLTLGSDASIGGSVSWDIRGNGTTFGGNFKVTKVGEKQISMVQTVVSVKDIEITAGRLTLALGAQLNDSNPGTVTVTGGTLGFGDHGAPVVCLKPIVLNGGGIATSGANATVASTIALAAVSNTITADPGLTLTLTGAISGSGALNKTGAGTLSLTSAPAYTGETHVTDGTLALAASGLADLSTVNIAAAGKLNLGFAGNDDVQALFIGGIQQPAGIYDASHESGRFAGQGTLTVTTGPSPSPYADWATANGIPGAGAAEDSDGDGIPNGIEFVIGGDPSGPDSASHALLPTITKDETYLNFVFRRTHQSASSDPFVEYNSDLGDWTRAVDGTDGVIVAAELGAEVDLVTVKIPLALAVDAKLFSRLKVNLP